MQFEAKVVDIRPVTEADEKEWRRLWTAYLKFYESSVAEVVYKTTFARLLSQDDTEFHGHLAWVDDRPVGLVHYLVHRHCWRVENTCYLQDLYADPEMRGHGVGRALIQSVYDAADAAGSPSVYWLTQDFNLQARKLYDRMAGLTPFVKYQRPT